jgi:hypothetical protein
MAPKVGKQATKGQKQILEENKETIKFYGMMAAAALAAYLCLMVLLFWEDFTFKYWMATGFTLSVYGGCIFTMKYMAKPAFSETGGLIDGGIDLNMEAGFAEHLKDLIILTATCQSLSLISNYFWFLWLFAPGRAFYILWVNVLAPYIFQPAPEPTPEADEKKQRKMDRRMRRMQ